MAPKAGKLSKAAKAAAKASKAADRAALKASIALEKGRKTRRLEREQKAAQCRLEWTIAYVTNRMSLIETKAEPGPVIPIHVKVWPAYALSFRFKNVGVWTTFAEFQAVLKERLLRLVSEATNEHTRNGVQRIIETRLNARDGMKAIADQWFITLMGKARTAYQAVAGEHLAVYGLTPRSKAKLEDLRVSETAPWRIDLE